MYTKNVSNDRSNDLDNLVDRNTILVTTCLTQLTETHESTLIRRVHDMKANHIPTSGASFITRKSVITIILNNSNVPLISLLTRSTEIKEKEWKH